MNKRSLSLTLLIGFLSVSLFPLSFSFRSFDHQDHTRIVFEADEPVAFKFLPGPSHIELQLSRKAEFPEAGKEGFQSKLIRNLEYSAGAERTTFRINFHQPVEVQQHLVLEQPFRIVFDLVPGAPSRGTPDVADEKTDPVQVNLDQSGNRRRAPIERICIDPGHGGNQFGAQSQSELALKEKDITLSVATRLQRLIEGQLGLRVIMTRERDDDVSLNSRISMANNQKAQMFVSVHVNSSYRKSARGSETYYVSLEATDQESFELAKKENQALGEIDDLPEGDDLKMILWNMAQTEYIRESSELAAFIQNELNILLETRNRGVKQAPFRVLMRAAMPAVLVEIAFLSNPAEEEKLDDTQFLDQVARAIYNGISKFIDDYNNRIE